MKQWAYVAIVVVTVGVLVVGTYLLRDGSADVVVDAGESVESTATPGSDAPAGVPGTASTPQADSDQSPGAVTASPGVAAEGAPLEPVTEPPGKTIAMFSPDRMPEDVRLSVEFEPFGIGPWGKESLVIKLLSVSVVSGDVGDVSALQGNNVIVRVEPQALSIVSSGGRYQGILRAVPDRDVTILSLVEAEPSAR